MGEPLVEKVKYIQDQIAELKEVNKESNQASIAPINGSNTFPKGVFVEKSVFVEMHVPSSLSSDPA